MKVIVAQFKEFAVDIPPGGSMGDSEFTPFPKRPKNVNAAYEAFRNVGVFIDEKEAKEALERLAIEKARQGPEPKVQETR